jgi:1-acyl-sn-glycerol-3-phosphate acyltransferase
VALRQWGEEFCFEPEEPHVRLVDRKRGKPVRNLELHAQDGRVLKPEDTVVVGFPEGTRPAMRAARKTRSPVV